MTGKEGENGPRWEGYSNYQAVSKSINQSVQDAIDSYAVVRSSMDEGAGVPPGLASHACADIVSASMSLLVEMQEERNNGVDDYDEILGRWEGSKSGKGRVQELHEARLSESVPGWLFQFVLDIKRAAWKLGYVRAGRRGEEEFDDPGEEARSKALEGL